MGNVKICSDLLFSANFLLSLGVFILLVRLTTHAKH